MSHKSSGWFYCRYTYTTWWDSPSGSGFDDEFHTAYYTPSRQDHQAQDNWYKNTFSPTAQVDCERIITLFDRNNLGRVYRAFDPHQIRVKEFKWTETLPKHTTGPNKGLPFGRQI